MTTSEILKWITANPGLAIAIGLGGLGLLINAIKASFFSWYLVVAAVAFVAAQAGGNCLYFYTFLLGMVTALAEIIGKFRDEPLKSLQTPHAVFYHVLNGAIAAFALKVLYLNAGPIITEVDQFKAVLLAGLGSMLLMRSRFFNIKVGGEDVSFGPEQVIKVFLSFMEGAIDRVRAQSRIDFVRTTLANIDFDKVTPYTETMLEAAQIFEDKDRKELESGIDQLRATNIDKQLKSYRLGFLLLNSMGEAYVSKLFDEPPSDWLIKAPVPEKSEGLGALLAFSKKGLVSYFAYGSSMSSRRFRERLGWSDPESMKFLKTTTPRKCAVHGYRLVFNKPGGSPRSMSGRANLMKDPNGCVEGVLYQLSNAAVEFLDKSESGYRRELIAVTVDGKEVEALAYVAEAPREGLKPPPSYMHGVIEGAREYQLSADYTRALEHIETGPEEPSDLVSAQSRLAETLAPAGTV